MGGASIAACLALAIPTSHAADGIWNSTTTGLWSVPANWLDNAVADGIGAEASFDLLDLTSEATVRLDSSRTVGNMVFGDLDPATAGGWLIDNNDNPANVLTLATEVGVPTITVNDLGTGMAVTISATLAGTKGFAKAGTGTLVLSGENTLTGGISLDAGVLAVHSDAALGGAGSGLTFTANSRLRFAAPATLAGGRTLTINAGAVATFDTEANDVEIQSTFAGAGALTKLGSGALRYTGTGAFSGPLSINGGIFSIEDGASLTTGALTTANAAGVKFHVNGGSYTSTAMSTINPPLQSGFVMDSGSAAFNGGIQTSGAADDSVIIVNGGTFTAASVTARRDRNNENDFTRGFIFRGGTGTAGTMGAGTSNSWGHLSIEGGTFTATGAITIGNQVTSGRGGAMRVTGGVFNSTDTVDGIVLSKSATIGANTNTANNARITFSGGVSTVEKFTMGFDETVAANGSNGRARIDLTGGTLYIGSGGIVKNGTPTTSVNLDSGVLGAKADWASAVGVTMGSAATNNVTIKAADEADVAHNITINGPVGGAGGFTKTGGGALILAGDTAAYTGGDVGVTVSEGTLQIGSGGTTGNLGTAPILNNATLAFNRSNTLTFGNNVSGPGSVIQAGPGVTSLTGTLTHTGGTTVNAGTLRLATTLPGSVTVNNGGALGGPGPATGSVTVNSGGRLSPSDAAGTASGLLTVGNVTLSAGSILDL
ncbi:MAG: beta strand repeat-containing protein, partial [Chthoniobacteraceae bacterium]